MWVPICGQTWGGALGSRAPGRAPAALPGLWCVSVRLSVTSLPPACVLLPVSFRAAAGMWFHLSSDCWDGGGIVTVGTEGGRPRGGAALCPCPGAGWPVVNPVFVFLAAAPALVTRLRGRRAAGTQSCGDLAPVFCVSRGEGHTGGKRPSCVPPDAGHLSLLL